MLYYFLSVFVNLLRRFHNGAVICSQGLVKNFGKLGLVLLFEQAGQKVLEGNMGGILTYLHAQQFQLIIGIFFKASSKSSALAKLGSSCFNSYTYLSFRNLYRKT